MFKKAPTPLTLIFITIYLDVFTYGMVAPLLPFYVLKYHGGAALAGLLGSLYAVMQLFSGPVLGPLSDRFGRRPVLLGCLVGTAAAYAILGLENALGFVFLAILLDGLTGGNLTTAQAYVADITPESDRARGLGLVGAAMGLGLMTGPALGGLLSAVDLHLPALVGCGIALLNIGLGLALLPESLPPDRRIPRLHLPTLNLLAQLRYIFQSPTLRPLMATLFALNLAFAGLQSNFPIFSQARFGWDARANGLFFAFVGICGVITQGYLVGKFTPRMGERWLIRVGIGIMALMLVGVALAGMPWLLFPLVGLAAFGTGISIPSLSSLVSRAVEPKEQGLALAGMQSLLSLAAIFGPALAGVAFELANPAAPYLLGSLVGLGALWISQWIPKKPSA